MITNLKMYIDGVDAETYGIYVLSCPPVMVAQKNIEVIQIPGRPGILTRWHGDYLPKLMPTQIVVEDSNIATASAALASAKTLRWSNDNLYIHDVVMVEQVTFERWRRGKNVFVYNATVQPLKRLASEAILTGETSYSLTNVGTESAQPKIVITGAGEQTLIVGSQVLTIDFAVGGETITIDSLNGQIYDASGNAWNKVTGDLPVIPVGTITVSTTGSALTVYPNWRWT